MAASKGYCFICGKTGSKVVIKNHVLKDHNNGDEQCYLIRAEGAYRKTYWLLFTVPLDATFDSVDRFLRQIWCECCHHLSSFTQGRYKFDMEQKISTLGIGETVLYQYDFGSTTEIVLTVVSGILRPYQEEEVCLLARNVPPREKCDKCGSPAAFIDAWEEGEYLCENCAENVEDEDALLPLVNSPRSGVCGYCGDLDVWAFDLD
jgi:hypothetical protein